MDNNDTFWQRRPHRPHRTPQRKTSQQNHQSKNIENGLALNSKENNPASNHFFYSAKEFSGRLRSVLAKELKHSPSA